MSNQCKILEKRIRTTESACNRTGKVSKDFKVKTKQIQNVESPVIQTPATPAAPEAINIAPPVHQHKTWANTTGIIPQNSRVITTQFSEEEATFRAPYWYETLRDKRARTRERKMASSKRKFKTIIKLTHAPGRREILDKKLF